MWSRGRRRLPESTVALSAGIAFNGTFQSPWAFDPASLTNHIGSPAETAAPAFGCFAEREIERRHPR
ncbi:MAG: hypothetical protein QOH35_5864 [Acidobacteriaceae bacterium]|nr:hypothetical protein [Acidobacteriaceae bacterium]